ncbi:MAG TPA: hypothetical protein VF779_12825 [Pyrinomonadaceae bacterium]
MSLSKVFASLFFILIAAVSAFSQDEKLRKNKDGQVEITPQMEEKFKRQVERLKDPSFIRLEIVPVSNCQDEEVQKVSDCYKAKEKIRLKLMMTDMSSESITFAIEKSYFPYSLQLFRDGQLVPYREDVAKIIDNPPTAISSLLEKLEPGKKELVEVISLDGWYRPLEPGHYLLNIKRRFELDGGWTNSASITFEVQPK